MADQQAAAGAKSDNPAGTLFISYASEDVDVAGRICAALEAAGHPCWIAPRDVRAGEPYAAAIVAAINACRLLLLVLTKDSMASPHVLREVERASSKQRPVLSIRLDNAELPPALEYFLSANHWLEGSSDSIDALLPRLIDSVRLRPAGQSGRATAPALVGGTGDGAAPGTESGSSPGARTGAGRWRARAAVVALAAALVAGGLLFADRYWRPQVNASSGDSSAAVQGSADRATTARNPANDESIAVLPFTDMSEKKDQEYFSDGLSEELIDMLSKVPGLRVPARTSSFYFKDKSADIPTIAKRLAVAHVLEGSVRKSGNNIRITAQLIRADSGFHLWSETYDRQLNDIFKVQDEIAGAVVDQLKLALLSGAGAPAATTSLEAYNFYLQARYFTGRDNPEDLDKAVALYERAIDIDPNYALAYAWLATCHVRRVANGADTDGVGYAKTRAAAQKAIALDPNLPEGYLALASAAMQYDFDWASAAAMLRKAQALDAENPLALQIAGHLTQATGSLTEAEDYFRRSADRDPLNLLMRRYYAKALYYEGRLPEAAAALRRIIELNPNFPAAHYELGRTLLAQGDPQAALLAMQAEPSASWKSFGLPLAYRALRRNADAKSSLDALIAHSAGSEFQVAEAYAFFGEPDQALRWLELARTRHDPGVLWVRRDPMFRILVNDPRYKQFLLEMRLPV
jgi:TolB-like protein/Tfp pilus assembly protein PilF